MSPTSRHISFQEGVRSVALALGLGGMLLPTAVQAAAVGVFGSIIAPDQVDLNENLNWQACFGAR